MKFIDFFAGIGGFRRGMELPRLLILDKVAEEDIM